MTKPILLLLISLVLCSRGSAEPVTFPTKAGEYSEKGWKYVYEIQHQGTRSERRTGRLFLNGKEVKGEIGELKQEPIGSFINFGEHGYNQGWLNTLTYDGKVFEKDGTASEQAKQLLHAARDKNKKSEPRADGKPPEAPKR